jgi:mRNA deadenylase 3'-5' endonuclease subunit Ccr4
MASAYAAFAEQAAEGSSAAARPSSGSGSGEPEFTNFAWSAMDPPSAPFAACLDYVFVSRHWRVAAVKPLPALSNVRGQSPGFPDAAEPSDHLLIAAVLALR